MDNKITYSVNKVKTKKKITRIAKILLLIIMLLLTILYFVVGVIYTSGNFSITLDKNLYYERGLIIYDDSEYKVFRSELYAKSIDTFDNISYKWLPDDLDEGSGSHNGDNYVAYSFYIENQGEDTTDYWYQVEVADAIKNVDEAVRIRVYYDGEYTTYAKLGANGLPEDNTTAFISDDVITLNHVEDFEPGDIDKFTVVIWIEGTDIDCTDNILGGEIKIQMDFNSEIVDN